MGDSSVVEGLLKMSKALGSIHSMRKTEGLGKGRMTTFKSIMQDVAFLTVDTRPPGKKTLLQQVAKTVSPLLLSAEMRQL